MGGFSLYDSAACISQFIDHKIRHRLYAVMLSLRQFLFNDDVRASEKVNRRGTVSE